MDIQSATTRLRRTFQYNDDPTSDEDSTPEMMDEEEQEAYITSLTTHNVTRNAQFRNLLLVLPFLSSLPYLAGLFHPETRLVSLLALSSLAATGYLLYVLPVTKTGISVLDSEPGLVQSVTAFLSGKGRQGGSPFGKAKGKGKEKVGLPLGEPTTSPIIQHLPWMNMVLSMVVALAGWLNQRMSSHYSGWIGVLAGLGNLPLLINIVVVVAKRTMAEVDPEKELSGLRYMYKGA